MQGSPGTSITFPNPIIMLTRTVRKDGTHPPLFHGVRSFTGADRPRYSIDASMCLGFSKSRIKALSSMVKANRRRLRNADPATERQLP